MSKPRKSSAKRATKKAAPPPSAEGATSEHERGMALGNRGASSETTRGASVEREDGGGEHERGMSDRDRAGSAEGGGADAGDRNGSVERPRDGRDGDRDRNG